MFFSYIFRAQISLRFHFFACVYFHSCLTIRLTNTIQKESGALIRQSPLGRAGLPVSKILKNKPHLFVFGNKYSQASLISDIRTNIRELSRFTESDKRKLAFFSIKKPLPCLWAEQRAKIQKYSLQKKSPSESRKKIAIPTVIVSRLCLTASRKDRPARPHFERYCYTRYNSDPPWLPAHCG